MSETERNRIFKPISPITGKDLGNPVEFLMPEITGLVRPIAIPKTMEVYYDDEAKTWFERVNNSLIEISLAKLLRKIERERKRLEALARPPVPVAPPPPPPERPPAPTLPPHLERLLERLGEFFGPFPEYREAYLYRDEYGHEWYSYVPNIKKCPFTIEVLDPKTGEKKKVPCPGEPKVIRSWSERYDRDTERYYPV